MTLNIYTDMFIVIVRYMPFCYVHMLIYSYIAEKGKYASVLIHVIRNCLHTRMLTYRRGHMDMLGQGDGGEDL